MNNGKPKWAETLFSKMKAHHAFILYGNVRDYALPRRIPLKRYLKDSINGKHIFISREGVTFPSASTREAFDKAVKPEPFTDIATEIRRVLSFLRTDEGCVVIIEDAELLMPDADIAALSQTDRDIISTIAAMAEIELGNRGHTVIIIVENLASIHQFVRSAHFIHIQVPPPDEEARRRFIKHFAETEGFALDDSTQERIARVTGGLGFIQIDDALWNAKSLGSDPIESAIEAKQKHFEANYAQVLSPLEPIDGGFANLGGYDHIKEILRRRVIEPMSCGDVKKVPMGILLMGPAGTGKTFAVRCLAAEIGFQCVELNIGGQIASKWQGEGERNLAKAFAALEAIAPVVVFVDEIDQSIKTAESGSENMQETRIAQMLLKFLSDTRHRGKILFVGATNRPDLMDARLKRPGRFDLKILFTLPDENERKTILSIHAKRLEIDLPPQFVIAQTNGWTPAELEALAIKASTTSWEHALRTIRPTTQDIALMLEVGLREVNDLDLLPKQSADPKQTVESVRAARR